MAGVQTSIQRAPRRHDRRRYSGETMALVRKYGCGNITADWWAVADLRIGGSIHCQNRSDQEVTMDILDNKNLKPVRRELRMIFQDPFSPFNHRMTVLDIIGDSLRVHGLVSSNELRTGWRQTCCCGPG